MRICITAEEFFPLPSGRLRRIYEVARRLAKDNEVHIYCQRYSETFKGVMDGIHLHGVGPFTARPSYPMRLSSALLMLPSILRNGKFDIINTNWLLPPLPSYIAAKLKRTPIILTSDGILWHHVEALHLHGYSMPSTIFGCMMEDIDVSLSYDAYIAVSKGARSELISMGVDPDKVFVIYNGVNLSFFDSIKVQERKEPTICYIGHLEARKNVLDLIRAFSIVQREISDAKLIIAGSGPLAKKARRMVKDLKLSDKVSFAGKVGFKKSAEIMKSSHLLVLPSLIEGFGLVLAEANACYKPVIAYDVPGVREIVKEGVNGYLVRPRNIQELADKIIKLLGDDELRRKMGEKGRRLIEKRFTWDRAAKETFKVYNHVLMNA